LRAGEPSPTCAKLHLWHRALTPWPQQRAAQHASAGQQSLTLIKAAEAAALRRLQAVREAGKRRF
jgi:hypothetical protein